MPPSPTENPDELVDLEIVGVTSRSSLIARQEYRLEVLLGNGRGAVPEGENILDDAKLPHINGVPRRVAEAIKNYFENDPDGNRKSVVIKTRRAIEQATSNT